MKCTTVITSFNRRRCIERAIDSALREMPDQEIVVVDDASTDGTSQFLKERYNREIEDSIISILELPSNVGVSGAKNAGYTQSKGDWVIFLDSDDYYEIGAGKLIKEEIKWHAETPIIFFRCRTNTGEFVGEREGESLYISLSTNLRHTSFGEALTAINKKLVGIEPPYIQMLRGYEGIGCARLIKNFGPARLSSGVARIYVTDGDDRLSVSKGFFLRMPLLAKGHLLMISEFGYAMGIRSAIALFLKATIYMVLGIGIRFFIKNK